MDYLLHIETATACCSVSISREGHVIDTNEAIEGNLHAEQLHQMTRELLNKNNLTNKAPLAVSVGSGPGSYTGMRIGVSFAKGLCMAYDVPLLGISSLDGMIVQAKKKLDTFAQHALWIPMIDARRMEVYCKIDDSLNNSIQSTSALILDDFFIQSIPASPAIYFFGNGAEKAIPLMKIIPTALYLDGIYCSSSDHAGLAWEKYKIKQTENLHTFDPQYLKEFVVKHKKET
ncbi:MAG: tRNA (adenosine(37)-N6)-threonylcarbamoyltransferase complex dimerization subunit type 1 TsaB [Bacteroidota bacterium]|jgi:tRNA threonylcarbamoyladenosine biosynthesis protein TsaB